MVTERDTVCGIVNIFGVFTGLYRGDVFSGKCMRMAAKSDVSAAAALRIFDVTIDIAAKTML